MQDGGRTNPPPSFDFDGFVSFLVDHGLNYTKAHVWEQAWHQSAGQDWYIKPTIYARSGPGTALDGGPKFDLNTFNADYFDRLRERVTAYGQNGIYVGIDLFDRFSVHDGNTMSDQWLGHPFNASNNINGIDGDPSGQGHGLDTETLIIPAITAYQEAYVEHLIDTLGDLDNVIWEVAMEPWGDYSRNGNGPKDWVNHFISYVRTYEESKPKQHPILQGVFYPPGNGDNDYLFASDADVISPNAGNGEYDHDSPSLDGTKVVLIDTDHILWTETDGADWAWRAFTRGAGGFAIMDGGYSNYDDQGGGASYNDSENFRYNLGWILGYAERMNLVAMTPRGDLCSTGYCLANPAPSGAEFLVYFPNGSPADVNLSGTNGSLNVEWFNPANGNTTNGGTISGGGTRNFNPPFAGISVLYLYQSGNASTSTPTAIIASTNTRTPTPTITPTQNPASTSTPTSTQALGGTPIPTNTQAPNPSVTQPASPTITPTAPGTPAPSPTDDGHPPVLSAISASSLDTTARITWNSNEPANGQVRYGFAPWLNHSTALIPDFVMSHEITLTGLQPGTTYSFLVLSRDAAGNLASLQVNNFRTLDRSAILFLYLPFVALLPR